MLSVIPFCGIFHLNPQAQSFIIFTFFLFFIYKQDLVFSSLGLALPKFFLFYNMLFYLLLHCFVCFSIFQCLIFSSVKQESRFPIPWLRRLGHQQSWSQSFGRSPWPDGPGAQPLPHPPWSAETRGTPACGAAQSCRSPAACP